MNYLWDTNILVHYIRNSDKYNDWRTKFKFFDEGNNVFLSVINIGEIESLAYQPIGELRTDRFYHCTLFLRSKKQ